MGKVQLDTIEARSLADRRSVGEETGQHLGKLRDMGQVGVVDRFPVAHGVVLVLLGGEDLLQLLVGGRDQGIAQLFVVLHP